jgi:hypothetical protein
VGENPPGTLPVRPASALDGVAATAAAAADAAGTIVARDFRVAGAPVRLLFAGEALAELLTPALNHVAAGPTVSPALTVHVWDSASTGTEPPPLPPAPSDGPFGAFYYYSDTPWRVLYQPGPSALSVFNEEERRAWFWVERADNLSHWECAAPFRHITQWWLRSRGLQQVHGGAVGTRDGGVMLVGKGGSGKSTAALAALDSDLCYAGDDYVAVELEAQPFVHSLYSSGKVEPHHLERLPHLRGAVWNAEKLETEKAVVFVRDRWPDKTIAGFPLRAVLVPKVVPSRREAMLAGVSRATALAALAPSTIFQLHPSGREALAAMARVVERVPTFTLEIGSDISSIPRVVSEFLSQP